MKVLQERNALIRLRILYVKNIKQEIIYATHSRHGYSGVSKLVKTESFHSNKQINFRNRIVDHNNSPSFLSNKRFRNVV